MLKVRAILRDILRIFDASTAFERADRAVEALDPFGTLNIAPSQIINNSRFSLYHEEDTPLRQIDYGGADQQLKCAFCSGKQTEQNTDAAKNGRIRVKIDRQLEPWYYCQ